ncbi:type VI secretion system protein TssA [Xanthobacter agilis]|uniref:Type VI secretion system protein VasJ n=1 Tax=Xanthobacter agilis TaxID=47492 RepID=A0ABU0LEM7_XANAG|nr:type VI secretion system protein TssA [Xanthobacter agilis]MDQ0505594.1 type VI secretion system protein VasJ [Xanthobacter agilis]
MSEHSIPVFEDARSDRLVLPLAPDAPVGTDVRGLPAFEEIETSVRRIETDGPAAVPWPQVARIGLDLLTTHGRDLLVTAWTTVALTQTEQWRGLAVGIDALSAMVKQWWDEVPPKRERARVGALEWMVTRLTPVVADLPVAEPDIPALLHASELLEELNVLLPEKLAKERIAFGDLVRAVRTKAEAAKAELARAAEAARQAAAREAAEKAGTPQAPAPATPLPANGGATPSPAPVTPAATASATAAPLPAAPPVAPDASGPELDRAISALADSMRQHARRLRETNLSDPRSYRLSRSAAWLDITLTPPAKDNATQLMAPAAQRLEGIAAMSRSGEHEALVHALEGLIGSSPFWLDAHRKVFETLNILGPKYAMAAAAVVELSCALVRRLPALVDLTFADGTPFADVATRAWFDEHAGSPAAAPAEAQADTFKDLAADIKTLVGAGKKAEALDRLGAARDTVRGERALFDMHLLQAQTCLDLDLPSVALPLVQHLESEVERRALDAWEPGLALRAARLALRAYHHPAAEKLLGATHLRGAVEAAQRRLARLDLRTAVRLVHA